MNDIIPDEWKDHVYLKLLYNRGRAGFPYPPFVPTKIVLTDTLISPDKKYWLFFGTVHECRYDRDGLINIGVSGGRMGLRPSEFQVLRWGINHLLDGGELTEAINFAKLMIMTGEERKLRTDISTTFPPDFPLSMHIEMRLVDQKNMRKSHLLEAAASMCDACKSGDDPVLLEKVAAPIHAVGPLYVHIDGGRFRYCLASPIHVLIDQDNHE